MAAAAVLAALLAVAARPVRAAEARVLGPEMRSHLALTLYATGAGLVDDQRRAELGPGTFTLVLPDLAQTLKADTAIIDAPGLTVLQQSFTAPTAQSLLERSVDTMIGVGDPPVQGRLLATQGGAVVRTTTGVILRPQGPLVLPALPAGVSATPTLTAQCRLAKGGRHAFDLVYQADGLSWRAGYVAVLQGSEITLEGRALLSNHSGAAFPQARVSLVAGWVNRGGEIAPFLAARAAAPVPATLQAYHLYQLPEPVTLEPGQEVAVALVPRQTLKAEVNFRLEGQPHLFFAPEPGTQTLPVALRLSLDPAKLPLPAGLVEVYQRGTGSGRPGEALRLLGEDRIGDIPAGQALSLRLGNAFDVTATQRQTEFVRTMPNTVETAHEVVLRNGRAEPVTVQVVEPLPGSWHIQRESLPHRKLSADRVQWNVSVPAHGSATLTFRVALRQ